MANKQGWQKRHAIQIVAQLPEDVNDALLVLEFAKQLVEGFLSHSQPRRCADITDLAAMAKSR